MSKKPKKNWVIGDKLRFFWEGFEAICKVISINAYSRRTGELHLTLKDTKTGEIYNSTYDKNREKIA